MRTQLLWLLLLLPAAPAALGAPLSPGAASPARADDAAVAEGRAHLEAGRLAEARAAFERAHAADRTFATRVWVLRVDLAEGRVDQVLSAISTARRAGERGHDLDYLVGLGMHARAMSDLARGGSASLGMFFGDAMTSLREVLEADPERYADADLPLAEAAWHSGEPQVALEAARQAVERRPERVEAHLLRGRAALAVWRQAALAALAEEGAEGAEGDPALWEESRAAIQGAIERLGDPGDAAGSKRLAEAHRELGNVLAFRDRMAEAAEAYARAIACDPDAIDLTQTLDIVGNEHFRALMESATKGFVARHGERDAREATLRWWLGWAQLESGDERALEEAEANFLRAFERWPAYTNSWFQIYRVRFTQADYDGAIAALDRLGEVDPGGVANHLRWDPVDLARVEYLVGHCVRGQKLLDAARLSRWLVDAIPEEQASERARHLNNIGLFYRDAGDSRRMASRRREMSAEERAELMSLYERSFAAYSAALALEPENPAYLNDTAVLLHYNLERDYERALEMYTRAAARAQELLEAGGLDEETEALYRTALRDARNNHRLLERKLAAERAAAEKAAREEAERRAGEGGDGDGDGGGDGGDGAQAASRGR